MPLIAMKARTSDRDFRVFDASSDLSYYEGSRYLAKSDGFKHFGVIRILQIAPLNQYTLFLRAPMDVFPLLNGENLTFPSNSCWPSTYVFILPLSKIGRAHV
jgi:hypothetical protein